MPAPPIPATGSVAFAGDWHGDINFMAQAIPAARRALGAPGGVLLHAGDFGLWPDGAGARLLDSAQFWCARADLHLIITPGNHEHWTWLREVFAAESGEPAQLRDRVWVVPPGHRWVWGGRRFLSVGGAASVDFESRTVGHDWFVDELISDATAARIADDGACDVLVSHDAPLTPATDSVAQIRDSNPLGWSPEALEYARTSAARLQTVVDAARPAILMHGHYHRAGFRPGENGTPTIVSLDREWSRHNLATLDLDSLDVQVLDSTSR